VLQRETYLRSKELWLTKSTELDDMLMYLERKKKLNLGLENKYFRIFGSFESEKSKFIYQLEKYKIILEIMHEHSELSYRELIRQSGDKLTHAERERNDLKNKITRSQNRIDNIIIEGSQSPVSDEFKDFYMQECKKLLRKLYFLLHTDTCPNYSGLSGKNKAEINKLWLKLMKSTKDEMYSFSPSMLLYSLPDYEQLKSIYIRACEILGMNPDCYDTGNRLEFMIRKGASIESIMDFLKSESEQLELHLARLELVQNEYTHEDQTQQYRNAMENINVHTESLKCEISYLKKQIQKLKKQITNEYMIVAR
jgi:predicted RNase H-like nuclease (RuvC/YqgF family)